MANDFCGYQKEAKEIIDRIFPIDEKSIAQTWSKICKVTNAGKQELGNSVSYYVLLKFSDILVDLFGLRKEIVAIFSPFSLFEPRTFKAFDEVLKRAGKKNRVEKICYMLFSKDMNIEENLRTSIGSKESQVIIPFTYDEAKLATDDLVKQKFKSHFYLKDLFDMSVPLKEEYFFFGRGGTSIEIIQKHKENQNSGLFGLRKTGKTSIIYDIIRKCDYESEVLAIFIDCQNPAFSQKHWNEALLYILNEVCKKANIANKYNETILFTADKAGELFEEGIKYINETTNKSILFLFDEIENITFNKSPVEWWRNGKDFIFFWQTIRSVYQRVGSLFTFCILGTNPMCVEIPSINGIDNPIFNIFRPQYLSGFDIKCTREMVRKLGKLMGIKFDECIYTKLTEDYGGHPFLIRQVCSAISREYPSRPVVVDRIKYNKIRDEFNINSNYFEQLIEVLKQFYPNEYEMLEMLATDNKKDFNYFAMEDYSLIKHLVGYGIIRPVGDEYDFCIDAIKEYLYRKAKRTFSVASTKEERWKELSINRNKLETALRYMVKTVLRVAMKEQKAKDYVIEKIFNSDNKYKSYTFSELFDSRISKIYLKSLKTIILGQWQYFSDYWTDQEFFISCMHILNKEGRFDCHATIPETEEMNMFMAAVKYINKGIEKFKADLMEN